VYERSGSTQGALLATYEKLVTDLGATTWEELSIGAELNRAVFLKVTIENTTSTPMLARFDDLKVEVFNTPTAVVVQENSYYPFGLNMRGLDYIQTPAKEDKFQYNGKEKQTDFGLNWSDYGARNYDFGGNRWTSIDPLAEKFYSLSPYNFSFNNPMRFVDPDGRAPVDDYYTVSGGKVTYLGSDGSSTNNQRLTTISAFVAINSKYGNTKSQEATQELQNNANSAIITSNVNESEYFQKLWNNGNSTTADGIREQSAWLLLDASDKNNPSLKVHTNFGNSGPTHAMMDDPTQFIKKGQVIIGSAHTHQLADFADPKNRLASSQMAGDGAATAMRESPTYTIDSEHIDKFVPAKGFGVGGKTAIPYDNIAPTQSLFNINNVSNYTQSFSILRNALETSGKKPQN
jgi:RHS repeat-associated protein